jgi:hypothetical protein
VTILNQLFGTSLYGVPATSGNQGWIAYLLPPNSGYTENTITLDDAWANNKFRATNGGVFVFSAMVPTITSKADVATIVNLLPKNTGVQQNGFLAWLSFAAGGTLTPSLVSTLSFSYTSQYYNPINNPLSLQVSKSVTLGLQTNCNVAFQNDLFTITPAGGGLCQLLTNFSGSALTYPLTSVYIPCYGPEIGCTKFDLVIGSAATNFLTRQLAISYYYGSPSYTEISYPMLVTPATDNYHVTADPSDLLNTTALRTYYLFAPPPQAKAPQLYTSYFSTDGGLSLKLTPYYNVNPYPNASNLVYPQSDCGLIVMQNTHPQADYDFIPSGNFYMSTVKQATSLNLLCGLSGVETINFVPANGTYAGDFISFMPGNDAAAPSFPPVADATPGSLLNNAYTTSWVAVQPSGTAVHALNYYSQPKGASLYAANSGVGNTQNNFLGFFEPVAADLSKQEPVYIPMVPYVGLNVTLPAQQQTIADFESKIVSPSRKNTISPSVQKQLAAAKLLKRRRKKMADAPPGPSDGNTISTSPQGLLVNVNPDWTWNQLTLAQNTITKADKTTKTYTLDFENDLNPLLQDAFQTNQQFLVISQNTQNIPVQGDSILGTFNSEMSLDGWPFLLNVPTQDTNGNYNNVIIFKFCDGALIDRVSDTNSWTASENFNITDNNGIPYLSSWLKTYIQEGIDNFVVNKDPNFQYFASIATNPDWQGIIALKTSISLQDFPPDLQGLLGGIDMSLFYGHHFGINVNYVVPKDGTGPLTMNPVSSMFGLIDYTDPFFASCGQNLQTYRQLAANPGTDYDFKVLTLKVLFENSKIQSFQSYVQLTTNLLFGDKVIPQNNNNLIIFTGSYENHNGIPAYVFNETDDTLLALDSNVWNGVEIIKGNFSTVVPQSKSGGSNSSATVNAKFSFWGFLNFKALNGIDLFSFGSATGFNSHEGLSYSNLNVDMSFDLNTPSVKTFVFDVDHMAFDLAQSISRSDSLYPHFPLQVTGITSGNSKSLPVSQGFVNVNATDLTNAGYSPPSTDWYGLLFNLNMGTLGALASSAGLNTTFLASWGTKSSGVGAGIKLPGVTPQAKMLSLQGVLNLSIGSIQLVTGVTQGDNPQKSYLLMLNSIALKFLGLKFPPGGNINFYLFGDPDTDAQPGSLGWYLAYKKSK